MSDIEALWDTAQTAEFLGVNRVTLRRWRLRGYGPPAIALVDGRGGMLRYDPAAVRGWLDERTSGAGRVSA